ncbi:DNA-directed RNA polymerase subunit alpha [bacterium]|nr:DNA-directed RNA polymerase subunit alpha [Candidatus Elulimicrobium humile]
MPNHIILPKAPVLVQEINPSQAIYAIEPLNPGYGVTIANSLRRVMLSSLEGVAVTRYSIKGISHEFTTIPNVLEDILDITLNIKSLRFDAVIDSPTILILKTQGAKVVTGSDLKLPGGVTIVNPEAPILTLTSKDAKIEMELIIEKGFGFRKDIEQDVQGEVGVIAVDSIFTPVIRVSYDVEDTRVGDKTNYNRVVFNIKTDGTISPLEVINKSANILVEQFNALTVEGAQVEEVKEEKPALDIETSSIKISTLDLSQRTIKALETSGIKNIAQLAQFTQEDLLAMKGVSASALKKLTDQIAKYDITLA